jgi:hypothetical protein
MIKKDIILLVGATATLIILLDYVETTNTCITHIRVAHLPIAYRYIKLERNVSDVVLHSVKLGNFASQGKS